MAAPSRRLTRRLAVGLVCACIVSAGLQQANAARPAPYQVNVQKDPKFNGGEPEIAVNPHDPNNLVMVWAAMKIQRPHTGPIDGITVPGAVSQFTPLTSPSSTSCQMAVSFDRGRSWLETRFPYADQPSCGDPMVTVDPAGRFYVSFDAMGDYTLPARFSYPVFDYTVVARSSDGGRSWSEPTSTKTYVDRPFTRVDPATGWIYVFSGGFGTPRMLTISKDHARTWSPPIRPGGSTPQDLFSHFAVAHGLVATATFDVNGQMMFNVSRDFGVTMTSIPVPGATGGSGGWVSADPRCKGCFAVMDQVGNVYRVYVTRDAGKSWSKAALVTNDPNRGAALPWMDYGANGVLAVMWKSTLTTSSDFEVYATISRDGGYTFAKPLKVSSRPSPPSGITADPADGAGDDLSWVTVDKSELLLGWGDRREGPTQAYFARVPLSRFPR